MPPLSEPLDPPLAELLVLLESPPLDPLPLESPEFELDDGAAELPWLLVVAV